MVSPPPPFTFLLQIFNSLFKYNLTVIFILSHCYFCCLCVWLCFDTLFFWVFLYIEFCSSLLSMCVVVVNLTLHCCALLLLTVVFYFHFSIPCCLVLLFLIAMCCYFSPTLHCCFFLSCIIITPKLLIVRCCCFFLSCVNIIFRLLIVGHYCSLLSHIVVVFRLFIVVHCYHSP